MEIILEYLKEVLKGITRAVSAHVFRKTFLEKEKTTHLSRRKQKGDSRRK